jgi:hypothetical protein
MDRKRILIIGNYRSGTTQLMLGLADIFNLLDFREPFAERSDIIKKRNSHITYRNHELVDRMVTKTLMQQIPTNWAGTDFEFLDNLRKDYDKVILLSRKNVEDRLNSYLNSILTNKWHDKYVDDEDKLIKLEKKILIENIDKTYYTDKRINEYSLHSGINLTWYEDLYNQDKSHSYNTVFSWNLSDNMDGFDNLWENYLSPNHKYRYDFKKLNSLI